MINSKRTGALQYSSQYLGLLMPRQEMIADYRIISESLLLFFVLKVHWFLGSRHLFRISVSRAVICSCSPISPPIHVCCWSQLHPCYSECVPSTSPISHLGAWQDAECHTSPQICWIRLRVFNKSPCAVYALWRRGALLQMDLLLGTESRNSMASARSVWSVCPGGAPGKHQGHCLLWNMRNTLESRGRETYSWGPST